MSIVATPEMIAAIASAVAAIAAAIATWRGPMAAARLAEKLRSEGEISQERRRLKFYVFTTIMQERAHLYSPDAVRAQNMIDVIFHNSSDVREAWASVYMAYDLSNGVPKHAKDERLTGLLRAMAADLGLSASLKLEDFTKIYHPSALEEQMRLELLQRKTALKQLEGVTQPSANMVVKDDIYPPAPK